MTEHESSILDRMEKKLDETLDWINGTNSNTGAKQRIASLEEWRAQQTETARDVKGWIMPAIAGAIVTGLSAAAIYLIVQINQPKSIAHVDPHTSTQQP